MADEASLLTVSDDEPCDEDVESSAVDPTISKKRKSTGAAAHRCLKRVEGKRVRLTNEQKAEIAVYADANAQLSREDIISWAVKKYDLDGAPAPALISTLRKPEKVKWAKEYLSQETVAHKMQAKSAHQSEYSELEKKLFSWFTQLESGQAVLTDRLIREKALVFAEEMKLSEFKASPNWLVLFKKRHNIKQYVLH